MIFVTIVVGVLRIFSLFRRCFTSVFENLCIAEGDLLRCFQSLGASSSGLEV
jgi:hypothetical protein